MRTQHYGYCSVAGIADPYENQLLTIVYDLPVTRNQNPLSPKQTQLPYARRTGHPARQSGGRQPGCQRHCTGVLRT
jgi:hypothetical protein